MKITNLTGIILLFSVLSLTGCFSESESDIEREVREAHEKIDSYLNSNNIEAERRQSGVYIEILEENEEGDSVSSDRVIGITYIMTHLEGEFEVESHADTLNPLRFSNRLTNDYTGIYPVGLNLEIGTMRTGETFRFYIPSYRAFNNYAHDGLFESFSNFILEVHLVEHKTEDENHDREVEEIGQFLEEHDIEADEYPSGLHHIVVEEGDDNKPGTHSLVEFHFTSKYLDGTVIDTSVDGDPIEIFTHSSQLPAGLAEGLQLMEEGEKAELILPSKLAFGRSVQVIPQSMRQDWVDDDELSIQLAVRPYTTIIYEVELLKVH